MVLVNATKDWAANEKWSDVYIKKRLEKYTLRMETKDDDKYNIPEGMWVESPRSVTPEFCTTLPTLPSICQ